LRATKIFIAGADVWRDIPSFQGFYQVSGHGLVRSVDRNDIYGRPMLGQVVGQWLDRDGYKMVTLYVNSKKYRRYVHLLVLEAFHGPRPPALVGCHRFDQKHDNRVQSLYWGTRSQNMYDSYRNGRMPEKTHCARGHLWVPANLKTEGKSGKTYCDICKKSDYQKKKALKNGEAPLFRQEERGCNL
jgi:hypothetical protein